MIIKITDTVFIKKESSQVVDIENLDVYLNKKIDDFINKLELIEK